MNKNWLKYLGLLGLIGLLGLFTDNIGLSLLISVITIVPVGIFADFIFFAYGFNVNFLLLILVFTFSFRYYDKVRK